MPETDELIERGGKTCLMTSESKPDKADEPKPLFDRSWEVFVVKLDKTTGSLIGKTACCALAPVN
jgi:hypothetical protein